MHSVSDEEKQVDITSKFICTVGSSRKIKYIQYIDILYHMLCISQKGYEQVCKCRRRTRPLRAFIIQLSKWEEMIHGEVLTDISEPNY